MIFLIPSLHAASRIFHVDIVFALNVSPSGIIIFLAYPARWITASATGGSRDGSGEVSVKCEESALKT